MLVEVVRAYVRFLYHVYRMCKLSIYHHNFELASFPGFPLFYRGKALRDQWRPVETTGDQWRPLETSSDH